jgi:hypothetical protein
MPLNMFLLQWRDLSEADPTGLRLKSFELLIGRPFPPL